MCGHKCLIRMSDPYLPPKINMTEAQAGEQKGKATVDHLLGLKNTKSKIHEYW